MMLVNYFLFIESKKRIPSVLHMTILTIRMATAAKHILTVVVAEMYVPTAVSILVAVIYAVVVNA
jgi:hypothetical protein